MTVPWGKAAQLSCEVMRKLGARAAAGGSHVPYAPHTWSRMHAVVPLTVAAAIMATACYTPSPMPLYARAERLSDGPAFEPQHTSNDCGIAAAAILLRLRHDAVSYRTLAEPLGPRRDAPLTFAQLRGLLNTHGLATKGIRLSDSDLVRLQSPVIAWLPAGHYVVVEPGAAGKIVVTDPAAGRWAVPEAQWIRYWTGYALVPNDALHDLAISNVGPMPHVPLTELRLTKEQQ
jgi:hypothetical protein